MSATQVLPPLSDAYRENSRWMMEHLAEIAQEHPNQWVAIYEKRVLAADDDLGNVTAATAEAASPSDIVFHFVDDGSLVFSVDGC